jgi:hypothetical protein
VLVHRNKPRQTETAMRPGDVSKQETEVVAVIDATATAAQRFDGAAGFSLLGRGPYHSVMSSKARFNIA